MSGFDPDRVDWREFPTVRKIGRYALFAFCAFSTSATAYAVARTIGFNSDFAKLAGDAVMVVVFFTLREMSKAWDFALHAQAKALTRDSDGSGEANETAKTGSTVGNSAGPKGIAQASEQPS